MTPSSATPIQHHAELDSTNAEAMRMAASGKQGPLWVLADVQTGGRGRSGRAWVSAPGNLFASFLFTTPAPIAAAHQLSLVAGVAAFDAIAEFGLDQAAGLRLKWPNDILLGPAKAGGILVESSSMPGRRDLTAVIGVGLNLASHPQLDGRDVTHLRAHHAGIPSSVKVLAALDGALLRTLRLWDESRGFASVRSAWLARSGPIGERVSVETGSARLSGRFAGLNQEGALLVELDTGELRCCTYGDVSLH